MKSSRMLVAAALFGVMGSLVKIAAADFSSAELVFYRSVFGVVAIYFIILLRTRRWTSALATAHWRAHLYRALAGFAALVLFFYAVAHPGEPEWRVVFYFALISSVGSAVWMAWQGARWPSSMQLPLLLAIGATATLAQLAMTRAHRLGNTLVVGSVAYSTVGFSALYGSLLFHNRLSGQSWGGIGLIVAAGLLATRLTSAQVGTSASGKPG